MVDTLTIEVEHNIQDKVIIEALKCQGVVVGYYLGSGGLRYEVAYFIDGVRHMEYLWPAEIRSDGSLSGAGYKTK